MVLVVLLSPLTAHTRAQFGRLCPNALGHGSKVDPQDSRAVFRANQDHITVIGVLKLDQMINIGGRVNRNPIRQGNANLERQEERLLSATGEDRETCRAGGDSCPKKGLYWVQRLLKVLPHVGSEAF